MNSLTKKRVLVTAGTQGIGRQITVRLLEAGCKVAVHYFSTEVNIEVLASEAGVDASQIKLIQGDLRNKEQAQAVVATALDFLGGMDVLVNNAGSLIGRRRVEELEEDFWRDSVDLNLSSVLWVTQAATPALTAAGSSSIVNLASLAGRKGGHAGSLAYSTMKGAVLTWTRALANELGPKGVRVNAVAPGLILGTSFHNTHTTKESADETVLGIPLGRAGDADDVARVVLFLASEHSGFVTGATIDVNGGVYGS
ncbi:SDR family NAD(P)-dependent oxidoreductase [Leucothrix arctica]|uniref:Oxidoreductase n=1 Tax=Leucothrix arctica TaxID=1481894 RepID=A0A317CLC6_9GAMM|nr:SDR family oxidoreductase [Leucothrix arctica]PWQ99394.1 oxidoreductase [Leucothrix arctica]